MDNDCVTVAAAPAPADVPPKDQAECQKSQAPNFLHSPPDSNNAPKSDASDSELSELEDEPTLDNAPPGLDVSAEPPAEEEPAAKQEEEEQGIGEVLPDHWSGTVPVFKPTMDQFKDFKRFVRWPDLPSRPTPTPTTNWLRDR